MITRANLSQINLDGETAYKLRCPECGTIAYLDDDQLNGRVSIECANPACSFHETHNLTLLLDDESPT